MKKYIPYVEIANFICLMRIRRKLRDSVGLFHLNSELVFTGPVKKNKDFVRTKRKMSYESEFKKNSGVDSGQCGIM